MSPPREPTELDLELLAARAPNPAAEGELGEKARAQLVQLRQQNAAFHATRDAVAWAAKLEKTLAAKRAERGNGPNLNDFFRPRWLGPVFAVACAALIWVQVQDPPLAETAPSIRSKGDVRLNLRVAKIEGTSIRSLAPGDVTHPGDVIQLQVSGALQRQEMVVFSIDGRGALTLHYPKHPGELLARDGMLPRSFELDDAPAFERFFLVSGAALPMEEVLQAAQKMAARPGADRVDLEFPHHFAKDVAQSTFLIRKEVP